MSATYDCECDNFEMMEDQDAFSMNEGIPGPGVPAGGSAGQILQKRSQEDYDTEWVTPDGYVPAGGSAGQILKKSSAEDYDTEWDSLDAGDVSFDSSLTYGAGTVGEELSSQRNTLNHKADVIYDTASGDIASFPDGADGLPVKDLTVGIEPVQSGTGDPSPTNVRPISGWTGANVTRTGKNLFGGQYDEFFSIHFNVDVTVCASADKRNDQYTPQIAFYDKNKTEIDYWGMSESYSLITGRIARSFTLPKESYYVRFITYSAENLQIEFGATNSSYEPYTGTTIPISWQSEAGTVYGGTLELPSCVLTVTHTIQNLGSLTWNYTHYLSNPCFLSNIFAGNLDYTKRNGICSIFDYSASKVFANTDNSIFIASNGQAYVRCSSYTDKDTFTSAMSGQTLVYNLDTPQTYQLTPQQMRDIERRLARGEVITPDKIG